MFVDFDLHAPTGWLALLRDREGIRDVVVVHLASGERVAEVPARFIPATPRFSPDGTRLCTFGNGRVHVHSIESGETVAVVDRPGHHATFASWSPDGRSLAYSAYPLPMDPGKTPQLFRVDLSDGAGARLDLRREGGADGFPQWSPSGEKLVFRRTFFDTARPYRAAVLTDRELRSERQMPLPEGGSHLASRFCWSPDDRRLLISETARTSSLKVFDVEDLSPVWSVDADGPLHGCFDPGGRRVLGMYEDALKLFEPPSIEPVASLSLASLSPVLVPLTGPAVAFGRDGEVVYFLGTDGVLYRWEIAGGCEPVMRDRPRKAAPAHERRDYRFTARDGLKIPVQRYLPTSPNGRAIVYVEGGPTGPIGERDPVVFRLLEEGYEVVRPAYRGTGGYGVEHERANRGECGRADVLDVVDCGLDWRRRFDAESRPLALSGFSYGGFLTFLALTHAEVRWCCGVTLWGATELITTWHERGLPADPREREVALRERSPVRRAGDVRSPLLILHGGRDTTATVPDVRSIHGSVRESGVPCELVVFEEDTHGLKLSRPEMFRRMLEFLDRYSRQEDGERTCRGSSSRSG